MLTVPELVLLVVIVFLIFGLHKVPAISKRLARLRLHFDKGVAEEYTPDSGGDESDNH